MALSVNSSYRCRLIIIATLSLTFLPRHMGIHEVSTASRERPQTCNNFSFQWCNSSAVDFRNSWTLIDYGIFVIYKKYSTIQKNNGNKNNKNVLNKNERRCRDVKTQAGSGQGRDSNLCFLLFFIIVSILFTKCIIYYDEARICYFLGLAAALYNWRLTVIIDL